MSFSVNTKALGGLPDALDRRGYDIDMARRYLLTNTVINTFGLADVSGVHQRVITAISAYLNDLSTTYADPDADRIRAVISSYRASDLRAAQRADAAIIGLPPGLPQAPPLSAAELAYGPSVFGDLRTPTNALITPTSHYADYPYQPSWSDVLSPTSVARDVIWRATSILASAGLLDRPVDPLEEFVRPFVGDWAGLLRCAEVFGHLGVMLPQESSCVTDEAELVPTVWTGNVAGRCVSNLTAFAGSLSDGFAPLADLGTTYQQVAKGVVDNANVMENLITNMIDLAADGLVDIATEGVLDLWSAGSQVRSFIRTIELAGQVINNVLDIVGDWKSGANSTANRFGVLRNVSRLPTTIPAPPIPLPTH